MTDGRPAPHPANTLNELSGEEWLYFTKSVLTTAYPSELGHAARKAHGANKPPRLMARLIEFFTRTGELVLDPFAGVGGTLLGAAIARGPRRALGIELDPRWVDVYETVVARARRRARRRGTGHRRPRRRPIPGGAARLRPVRLRAAARRRARRSCRRSPTASIDFVATDPPYNVQLPLTMAGGTLAEAHANRRTDYAMVTDSPADLANAPDYATFLDRMGDAFAELERVLRPGRYAVVIVRDAYQDGRYLFTGADLAARGGARRARPEGRPDLVPGRHAAAAVRLSAGVRPEHRPPAHPGAAQGSGRGAQAGALTRGEVGGEDVVVDVAVGLAHRPGVGGDREARGRGSTAADDGPTTSPRVILWIQPRPPSGAWTSQ